jgi:hypothetical protein
MKGDVAVQLLGILVFKKIQCKLLNGIDVDVPVVDELQLS